MVSPTRPIALVLTFDGTLTRGYNLQLVANVGYARQKSLGREPQPPPWSEFVDAYKADLRNCSGSAPKPCEHSTLDQVLAWQGCLQPIEEAYITRILDSGLFDHVRREDMEAGAKSALEDGKLELRKEWADLFNLVGQQKGNSIHVINGNWSAVFFEAVLRSEDLPGDGRMKLYSHELPSIHEEIGSSYPVRIKGKSPDRMYLFREIRSEAGEDATIIYVGNSFTDLNCLLAADYGICLRDEPMDNCQKRLADTCIRIGIKVKSLEKYNAFEKIPKSDDGKLSKTLFYARNFGEIKRFVEILISRDT